jgi:putative salt-induced outer membrane protein YdiY
MLMALASTLVASDSPWSQSLSLGLNLSRGNTESTQFSGSYAGKRQYEMSQLSLKANGAFGEENNTKNTDNYAAEAKFRRTLSGRLFWYVNTTYESDNIASLDSRITVGPGFGYQFYESETTKYDIEGGLGYDREKYDNIPAEDGLGYRLAHNFEHHLSSTSKLWHEASVTGPADEGDAYVIKAELGVQSQLAGNLSLKSVLRDTYSNDPILGNKKNDITLSTFLVYSF